jgi:hypothetical protein
MRARVTAAYVGLRDLFFVQEANSFSPARVGVVFLLRIQ